jgi:zinc protease
VARPPGAKVTTRKIKGIYQTEDASVFLGMEVLQKTPDKLLYKSSLPNGMVVRDVCDGHSAWIEDPLGGYHQYEGAALESHIRVAQYIDRGKAILLLATGKVTGVQQIGTHKTYVVEFIPQKNLISRMYFDADTGFVVHTEDVFTTPDGPYVLKLDFDDYRTVEGLKFPFRMKRTEKGAILNIRVTQVSLNAAMDDSLFLKPESAPK